MISANVAQANTERRRTTHEQKWGRHDCETCHDDDLPRRQLTRTALTGDEVRAGVRNVKQDVAVAALQACDVLDGQEAAADEHFDRELAPDRRQIESGECHGDESETNSCNGQAYSTLKEKERVRKLPVNERHSFSFGRGNPAILAAIVLI